MLFAAKWNVPEAAKHCSLSHNEMKNIFNDYCHTNDTTYNKFITNVQLSLDL
tara:strand:- start:261 stop:416 length:156 start_codon:yes stop_codon:yes gene_type:complete